MASTSSVTDRGSLGRRRTRNVQIVPGTYATNGVAIAPGDVELSAIHRLYVSHCTLTGAYCSHRPVFDSVNSKIVIYDKAGTEITNATDLSGMVIYAQVHGIG